MSAPRRCGGTTTLPSIVCVTRNRVDRTPSTDHLGIYASIVEVTVSLVNRRNVHFCWRVVGVLNHLLVAGPEEQFVLVRVEAFERDWPADIAADVVEVLIAYLVLVSLLQLLVLVVPIVGVSQSPIASVNIGFAMELLAAALAEGLQNRGSLGIFSAVRSRQILDAVGHVLVDVGNLGSGIAWISEVGTVENDGSRAVRLR